MVTVQVNYLVVGDDSSVDSRRVDEMRVRDKMVGDVKKKMCRERTYCIFRSGLRC